MKILPTISKICTFAIFLALIRTIAEPMRLQYYSVNIYTYEQIQPYLLAALITATGLLIMTILHYFKRYAWIIGMAVVLVGVMLYIKFHFQI